MYYDKARSERNAVHGQSRRAYQRDRSQLEHHADLYYNKDEPEITDYRYDMLMQELKRIEEEYPQYASPESLTRRVGGTAKPSAGQPVRHEILC